MVDLRKEVVWAEKRSPAPKDWMCHLQDSVIDLCVIRCQAGNKILVESASNGLYVGVDKIYIDESIPTLPEVWIRNQTDRFPELCLYRWRHSYHKPNKLILDRNYCWLRELVAAFLILKWFIRTASNLGCRTYHIVKPDVVLEAQGTR